MPEHVIRLRGGWERVDPLGRAEGPRVTLPLPRPGGPVRLARSFQAPRVDPAREAVWLRVADAPGLRSVRLNGRDLGPADGLEAARAYRLPADLPARNRLELAAEPASDGWGSIALVIRDRNDPPPDAWRGEGPILE